MAAAEPQSKGGYEMKGRRKTKTCKWHVKSTMEGEARKFLQARSEKQGRLLDLATHSGKDMEPVGRLSG